MSSNGNPNDPDFTGFFDRVQEQVDVRLLRTCTVVIVGVGTMGSQVTRELANHGVGRFVLIDGDVLEASNLPRHVLTIEYVGMNKAVGMAEYLKKTAPVLAADPIPYHIEGRVSDTQLDFLLKDAQLVIAAPDDRPAQRRVAERALVADVPCVVPNLYEDGGGEVFVQTLQGAPCYLCWDNFRPEDRLLRAVSAINTVWTPIVALATHLSLGSLDPNSQFAHEFQPETPGALPRQIFVQPERWAGVLGQAWRREPGCPACALVILPEPDPVPTVAPAPTRERTVPPVTVRPNRTLWHIAALILIVCLGFGVWKFASRSNLPQVANAYITRLHFGCVEPALCDQASSGYHVPLFIDGMDENLAEYLMSHGYTDEWIGNGEYFTDDSGDPTQEVQSLDSHPLTHLRNYIYVSPKGDSGLMLQDGVQGAGLKVRRSPGITLGVTWVLMNKNGEVVKWLHFEAPIVECPAECKAAEHASPVAGKERVTVYPPDYYAEPPKLFPDDPKPLSTDQPARELFVAHCGQCHRLSDANTRPRGIFLTRSGLAHNVGPNLDMLQPPEAIVLDAIEHGRNRGVGYMPSHILTGSDARTVAAYVGHVTYRPLPPLPQRTAHAQWQGSSQVLKIDHAPDGRLQFVASRAEATAGTVTIESRNDSAVPHDLVLSGPGVHNRTPIVDSGETVFFTDRLRPGRYVYYCSVPGHRQAGEHGVLVVRPR